MPKVRRIAKSRNYSSHDRNRTCEEGPEYKTAKGQADVDKVDGICIMARAYRPSFVICRKGGTTRRSKKEPLRPCSKFDGSRSHSFLFLCRSGRPNGKGVMVLIEPIARGGLARARFTMSPRTPVKTDRGD